MLTQDARPCELEPRRERLGCACDLGTQRLGGDVAPGRDLVHIRARSLGTGPGEDPAQLMLDTLRVVLRPVGELEQEFQLCPQTEFLAQAAMDGVVHALPTARMRAAGVGPVARPQALALRALLQKQFARGIEHEQRERAVQWADAEVRIGLRQEADLAVLAVDQNQLLIIAGYDSAIEFRVCQAAHQPRVGWSVSQ